MTRVRRVLALPTAIVLALIAVVVGTVVLTDSPSDRFDFLFGSDPTPSRVQFNGREYERGTRTHLPGDAIKQEATTDGGGAIYLDNGNVGTPTGIYVVHEGAAWGYGLLGGP